MLGGLDLRTIAVAVKRALQSVVGTIGTNGSALVADSSQSNGARWAPKAITPGGRVTLATGDAVPSSDQTGKTTVYYTPCEHDIIELFDGTGWQPYQFAELSQATTDASKSPAAVANNSNYDVFFWSDAGTLRATRGPAWSSDTARGTGAGTTELEVYEGRRVNKYDITNGPAARRGVYVSSIRSDGSAQINDSLAKRHVWNAFNRRVRPMAVLESTSSWTYTTETIRQMNNSAANQLDFVIGLNEDSVEAIASAVSANATASTRANHIGLDSTSIAASYQLSGHVADQSGFPVQHVAKYEGLPGIGRHYLAALEISQASGTTTWNGTATIGGTVARSGIVGRVLA